MKRILIGMLIGSFANLVAMEFTQLRTEEGEKNSSRKLAGELKDNSSMEITEATLVDDIITDFSRISVEGMADIISYNGKNYPEKFKHVWNHDYERKGSIRHTQSFIVVDGIETFLNLPVPTMFTHVEERPIDNPNALFLETKEYKKTLYRTTEHGKKGIKRENCWKNCNIELTVRVQRLLRVSNDEADEIIDTRLIAKNCSVIIQMMVESGAQSKTPITRGMSLMLITLAKHSLLVTIQI